MNKIPFEDLPNTQTPVDASNLNTMQTNIETEVNKKINFIHLMTVDNTAPEECNDGDKYYNTTNELIYTATGTDTWGTVGVTPDKDCLYIDDTNKALYMYNGTNLENYGAAATDDLTSTSVNPASIDAVNAAISDLDDEISNSLTDFINNYGFVDSNVDTSSVIGGGNWKIRKWNNGFVEMWGHATHTCTFNQTYGSGKYGYTDDILLPITVVSIKSVHIQPFSTGHILVATVKSYGTTKFGFFIEDLENASRTYDVTFEYYVIGNWK